MSDETVEGDEVSGGADDGMCEPSELVEMVRCSDHRALERITHCYRDRLVKVGLKHCATAAQAEDAVQDTFVSAADNLESFRGEGSLDGWLMRIVINYCRRRQRGRKNNPTLHTTEAVLEAREACPERAAARLEIRDALQGALGELAAEDRAIVILSDAMGWKSPEIADRLDMSSGAVRTRLHRLHKKLRGRLVRIYE